MADRARNQRGLGKAVTFNVLTPMICLAGTRSCDIWSGRPRLPGKPVGGAAFSPGWDRKIFFAMLS